MIWARVKLSEAAKIGFYRGPPRPSAAHVKRGARAFLFRRIIAVPLAVAVVGLEEQRSLAQQIAEPVETAAPGPGGDRFGATSADHLVGQKLQLLEIYLASTTGARFANNSEPQIEGLIASARENLAAALQAVAAGDSALAAASADLGIRNMAKASSLAGRRQAAEVDRQRLEVLRRQIHGYLATLKGMLEEPSLQASHGAVLRQIEALLQRSEVLAKAEAYEDADVLLKEAYPMTLKAVADLHQGKTLVARLEFAGPEDEFDYESKRYVSYEMLAALALNYQGQTDRIVNRIAAERYLNQGRLLRARAEKDASQGHHEAAIETMEQATQHLIDALRASGVEGFY